MPVYKPMLPIRCCDLCRIQIVRFTNRCIRSDAVLYKQDRSVYKPMLPTRCDVVFVQTRSVGLQIDASDPMRCFFVQTRSVGLQTDTSDPMRSFFCTSEIGRFTNACIRSDAVIFVEYRYVGVQTDACEPIL